MSLVGPEERRESIIARFWFCKRCMNGYHCGRVCDCDHQYCAEIADRNPQ